MLVFFPLLGVIVCWHNDPGLGAMVGLVAGVVLFSAQTICDLIVYLYNLKVEDDRDRNIKIR